MARRDTKHGSAQSYLMDTNTTQMLPCKRQGAPGSVDGCYVLRSIPSSRKPADGWGRNAVDQAWRAGAPAAKYLYLAYQE